jgi:aldehyde:ferredoxin oxidoreductase
MGGYFNKKIVVDLTANNVSTQPIADQTLRRFVGGSGLAARMLWERLDRDIGPLDPESRLLIATGPFTGTRVPSSGRHAVVARSPLTGIFGVPTKENLKALNLDGL